MTENEKEKGTIFFGKELKFGKDGKTTYGEDVTIGDQGRLSNIMVLSTKNSGKTHYLIPLMVNQDMENKDAGMTIIVGRSEIAYELYAMAKKHKRKVKLLKPSTNFNVLNQLLYAKTWDYDMINDHIINFKESIRKKEVIIIDMETESYSMHSIKAVDMLLMQLQSDMMDTDITGRRRHYVYIDEAYRYIDFLNNLLEYGDDYNVSTTLFFQSRSQFINENNDYTSLINNNVRNVILLQGLTYEDAQYYTNYLYTDRYANVGRLLDRGFGQFTFSFLKEGTNVRKVGTAQLCTLSADEAEELHRLSVSARRKLLKELKQKIIGKRMQLFTEREMLNVITHRLSDEPIEADYLSSIEAESAIEKPIPTINDVMASYENNDDVINEIAVDDGRGEPNDEITDDLSKNNINDLLPIEKSNEPINASEDEEYSQDINDTEVNINKGEVNDETEGFQLDINEDDLKDLGIAEEPRFEDVNFSDNDINHEDSPSYDDNLYDDPTFNLTTDADNKEDAGFDVEKCEFIIGGVIETDIASGIKSARPIRLKMPYKQMRNAIMEEEFKKTFK